MRCHKLYQFLCSFVWNLAPPWPPFALCTLGRFSARDGESSLIVCGWSFSFLFSWWDLILCVRRLRSPVFTGPASMPVRYIFPSGTNATGALRTLRIRLRVWWRFVLLVLYSVALTQNRSVYLALLDFLFNLFPSSATIGCTINVPLPSARQKTT